MAALPNKYARENIPRRIYSAVKGYFQAQLAIKILFYKPSQIYPYGQSRLKVYLTIE